MPSPSKLHFTNLLLLRGIPFVSCTASLLTLISTELLPLSVSKTLGGNIAFWDGSSEMKSRVCAHPAYFPYLLTKASATRLQIRGVKLVPASSGRRYLVAIFCKCRLVKLIKYDLSLLFSQNKKHQAKEELGCVNQPSTHEYQRELHDDDPKRKEQCTQQPSGQHQVN